MAVRFDENDVRVMGRTARGVRGIRLSDNDFVVGTAMVTDGKKLITVTENGFGKRCEFDNYTCHNRGGKGVVCHSISEKTGKLCGIASVNEDDDLMMITNEGTLIRIPVDGIPVYSRTAGGVIVMRLSEGAKVYSFAVIAKEKEADSEDIPEVSEITDTADNNSLEEGNEQ